MYERIGGIFFIMSEVVNIGSNWGLGISKERRNGPCTLLERTEVFNEEVLDNPQDASLLELVLSLTECLLLKAEKESWMLALDSCGAQIC